WLERFGPERTEALLKTNNERPPLTVRIKQPEQYREKVATTLVEEGIKAAPGDYLSEALNLLELPHSLEESAAFKKGWITPQDESSMLVAHLVNPKPGEFIVDLCAAPGGKSTHLAELMNDQGSIISLDDHPHKVNLIKENARRLNLTAIQPQVADARTFILPGKGQADAVLVDAPCSGTGVLRRRVDARYRREFKDLDQLAQLQREILQQAATLVKPGGRLVYSTCTLEPEENQKQSEWFLANHPDFELADYRAYLPGNLSNYLETEGQWWVTLLPATNGGDGFFICRFNRR
ncbi:MAG TPA: 16S rRNA (cytosine(967)-C(5))-methyltransferase RsmB, partial [Bacillota bacterium]|nr:16S rRNA (cytosine(967)-C(5))-methyltransferase RsmB [Bacillota bacterium]